MLIVGEILDSNACGDLRLGDQVQSWNEHKLIIPETTEFLAELSQIGDQANITYKRENEIHSTLITILPYYPSYRYVITIIFVGLVTWCVGVFILIKGPPSLSTTILHFTLVALAISTMMTNGTIAPAELRVYLARAVFFIFYMVTVAGFFFFSTLFPKPQSKRILSKALIIFTPVSILVLILIYYHLKAIYFMGIEDFVRSQIAFDIFHLSIYAFVGGAAFNFIHALKKSQIEDERARIKLILWGVIIGATPFLLFSVLPQLSDSSAVVREEFTLIFLLVIPLTFTLAIVKYQLFNIDILINRTIVYSVLTLLLGSIYIITIMVVISLIGGEAVFDEYLFILLTTLVVAIIFNPLRTRIQKVIDEVFFTARTNFRKAISDIAQELHKSLSSDDMFHRLIRILQKFVRTKNMVLYSYSNGLLHIEAYYGDIANKNIPISQTRAYSLAHSAQIYAVPKKIQSYSKDIDYSKSDFLTKSDFALCMPLIGGSKELLGLFFTNPLHPRFIEEEIDLLITGCTQAAEILDRLLLQEKIIVEKEEKKRLKDLNEIKSYFVSSVSHEFQTPLTSIKMFAELLQDEGALSKDTQKDYLETIEGESERLSRMVKNVLDFSKIERGVKEYHFSKINVKDIIKTVIRLMKYQLEQHAFKVDLNLIDQDIYLTADPDALIASLTNLISNAIKYSREEKYLSISISLTQEMLRICVEDKGVGISEEDQKHIFETFYRSRDDSIKAVGGVGLGLALVKHVVDAHKGKIELKSTPNKGTSFCIILPMESTNETNSDH
jgi:signal transduction histidine kinase